MHIVVFGIGGVGGFFGGKLAESGADVTFVARGKHFEAIRSKGLEVKSISGNFKVRPKVVNSIDDIQAADLIILAVKSWQVQEVAQQIKPIVGENTIVLPLQNGADNADKLRAVLDPKNVLAGLCRIVARIEAPGVIDHFAFQEPEIIFGEYDGSKSKRLDAIKAIFDRAGINSKISDNIHLDIWRKFLFITTVSGIGALTRSSFGEMREDEHIRSIMYQTANEIVVIANAKNIPLGNEDIEKTFAAIDNTIFNTTASMQRDIMEGRPSELEDFNGYIVKMGKQLHINTTANSFIYNCLALQEKRARQSG
ncbi:MAG: 2-dehydropantoate 2-reductase [Bacteroidia bacterium]|nr:2-dehydropantoate 2-reductase [Bacteroidia bacterium]